MDENMDIMTRLKIKQQNKTEAIKEATAADKAKTDEYAKLSARIDGLENVIVNLQNTISELTRTLQGITPAKISEVQQAGVHLFDPMKQTAAELNKNFKEAGEEVIETVKNATTNIKELEFNPVNWKGKIVYALFTAIFFCIGQFLIQYNFAPNIDYAKRLLWNVQYGGTIGGGNDIRFYDSEEEAEHKYNNQKKYEENLKLKRINEAKKENK